MPLYYVTGPSGTGKSTLCLELRRRGLEAYDTDDDGLARWVNKQTKYVHPKSSIKAEQRTPEFISQHEWLVPQADIETLAARASRKNIFLLGMVNDAANFKELFKASFALYINEETTIDRLTNRTNNNWGKQAHELAQTLDRREPMITEYRQLGYIMIDAGQPAPIVADTIVGKVAELKAA